jgi:plasmid stabilization system protein ParE
MATVRLSAPADDALTAIILHRRQAVGFLAARALRQRIMGRIYQLRDFPELGRRMHQSPYDDRRELIVTPYRVLYRVVGDTVIVLTIVDARYPFLDRKDNDAES